MSRHVTYDEYLLGVARTLARRHRPTWNHILKRVNCRCGRDLPCPIRHRVPINRGHWPENAS
ncbi:hypothetical protein QQG74_29295 [Micromonospora sp. FIMYZ51]|uniref:hypothetical protein n=1 Tax=Micromonospora sp. FIMYZ51 TaxID=3051832 RepID=UPI00311E799C